MQEEQFQLLLQSLHCYYNTVGEELFLQHLDSVFYRKRQGVAEKVTLDEDVGNLIDGIDRLVWDVFVMLDEFD